MQEANQVDPAFVRSGGGESPRGSFSSDDRNAMPISPAPVAGTSASGRMPQRAATTFSQSEVDRIAEIVASRLISSGQATVDPSNPRSPLPPYRRLSMKAPGDGGWQGQDTS